MRKLLMLAVLLAAACTPKDGIRTLRTSTDREADLGKIREIDGPLTFRPLPSATATTQAGM